MSLVLSDFSDSARMSKKQVDQVQFVPNGGECLQGRFGERGTQSQKCCKTCVIPLISEDGRGSERQMPLNCIGFIAFIGTRKLRTTNAFETGTRTSQQMPLVLANFDEVAKIVKKPLGRVQCRSLANLALKGGTRVGPKMSLVLAVFRDSAQIAKKPVDQEQFVTVDGECPQGRY